MASINSFNNIIPANNLTISAGLLDCFGSGVTDGILRVTQNDSSTSASQVHLRKINVSSAITSGMNLGNIGFYGYDGSAYIQGARILSTSSGTIAANRIPCNLQFFTHPDSTSASTQRMVIDTTGAVTINTPDSGVGLTISGGGETITSGNLLVSSGNATFTQTTAGTQELTSITHTDNTNAASHAATNLQVGGASGGDAKAVYTVSGVTNWVHGIDNSDSDAFVLSASATPGTTNVIRSSVAGEINYPLQPAFLATITNNITDVTGDGTSYTVIFDNEIYDQNADFNLGTSVFTAPVTGRYHFSAGLFLQQLGALFTDYRLTLVTSNRNYSLKRYSPSAIQTSGLLADCGSSYADMDSGDTATLTILVAGSTKTVDVLGDAGAANFFGGKLVA